MDSAPLTKHIPEPVTLLRAVVSAIPYVGGPLDHLLFDKADAIRLRNVEVAIAALSDQIGKTSEDALDKSWFDTDEAVAAFKALSDKVSFEPDGAKVDALGRVVGTFGTKNNSGDAAKLSVVDHLSHLSATQIKLLSVLSRVPPKERTIDLGGLSQKGSAIWLSDIVAVLEAGPKFWEGTMAVDEELEVLESFNVIRRVQFMGPVELAYAITTIGRRAASYVRAAGL